MRYYTSLKTTGPHRTQQLTAIFKQHEVNALCFVASPNPDGLPYLWAVLLSAKALFRVHSQCRFHTDLLLMVT
jgi:peptidoglycan/xylan/chitin deacetylase (PgdA/CDA1 family)